jgi:hypothetical protein
MMLTGLSNNKDHGGRTALVEYTNEGEYVATHWMPTDDNLQGAKTGQFADGYGYDVRVLPRSNVMVTSSFTGWSNYMMDFGKMLKDEEAMKRFGNTVVVWDLHTRKPRRCSTCPARRWRSAAPGARDNYCFTTTALTSKIWLIYEDEQGEGRPHRGGDVGDPSQVPLPVDISISADDRLCGSTPSWTARRACSTSPIPSTRSRSTSARSASRSTWSRRAGTASASTSPPRCSPTGTRRATTTSSSYTSSAPRVLSAALGPPSAAPLYPWPIRGYPAATQGKPVLPYMSIRPCRSRPSIRTSLLEHRHGIQSPPVFADHRALGGRRPAVPRDRAVTGAPGPGIPSLGDRAPGGPRPP